MYPGVSWIHFGDLHIEGREDSNYRDFLALIDEANCAMQSGIDFALLPGDNADDGTEDQYKLVQAAVSRCNFPVHAITGDHDVAGGNLDLFRRYLSDTPHRSFTSGGHNFVLLNSMAVWHPPVFGLGPEQMQWLRFNLTAASLENLSSIVFMHAYPSQHGEDADELRSLFRRHRVLLVEMGHTHYNELANDGHIIYTATRSTGQIEEGPPGFSVTTIDRDVVNWKFKPIGEWPFVMITSPADVRMIVNSDNPRQVVRGEIPVRARVWGPNVAKVTVSIDGGLMEPLSPFDDCTWFRAWDSTRLQDGSHELMVMAEAADGRTGSDRIVAHVNQKGRYGPPPRRFADRENTIGAWPEKHILGTRLGPNENGHRWPSRRERERSAQ